VSSLKHSPRAEAVLALAGGFTGGASSPLDPRSLAAPGTPLLRSLSLSSVSALAGPEALPAAPDVVGEESAGGAPATPGTHSV
jgi:hypothetical protein